MPRLCVTLAWLLASVIGAGALPASGQTSVAAARDPEVEAVRAAIVDGRYAQAEADAEGLLTALARVQPLGAREFARADILIEALLRNGKGAEARTRTLAEQVVRAKTNELGATDPAVAVSLCLLGDAMFQAGDYAAAAAPYQRAISIREEAFGGDAIQVADALDRLARTRAWTEGEKEGVATIARSLAIKEKRLDARDPRIADTLAIQGLLLQRTGDYAGARAVLDRALTIREAIAPDHPDTAIVLGLRSDQAWLDGNFVVAKDLATRAVKIAETALRPGHPDLAAYLRSLAVPIDSLGDQRAAHALRERAVGIAEGSLGSEHPLLAMQLNDLGLSYTRQAEYAKARTLLERALHIYETRLGPNHRGTITAVHNLAIINGQLGDFAEAQRLYQRAIAIWTRKSGPNDPPYVAYPLSALAELLGRQGRYAEARVLYERVLAIRERKMGKQHPDVANTLDRLAACMAKLGQLDRAEALSARALNILEQSGAGDTRALADALKGRARLQAARGDFDGARASYDRALTILTRIVGPEHPDVGDAEASLATTLASGGHAADALQHALTADATIRDYFRLTLRYLPERQALEFVANRPRGLDIALSVADADVAATAVILDRVVRGRTLILDEIAARRHEAAEAARPDLAPLWTSFVAARQRLANLVVRGGNERQPGQYLTLLENARREKDLAERALAERSATFTAELKARDIDLAQVRAALPAGSVLVSFVRFDRTKPDAARAAGAPGAASPMSAKATAADAATVPSYVAFVIRAGETSPILVPLGDAATLDRLIARWRQEVVASAALPATGERSLRRTGGLLRQRVWDPIATRLGDASRVFVVPDGAINLVPLAALPVGASQYLVESGPVIHYLSAERDLVSTRDGATVGRGLLALGGPAFDDRTSFAAPSMTMARRGADGCGSLQSLRFEPLPSAAAEATEVTKLWTTFGPADVTGSTAPSRMLIGREATEATFKQQAPGSRILHLATHGFFLDASCTGSTTAIRGAGTRDGGMRGVGGLAKRKPPAAKAPARVESPLLLAGLALAGANRRATARGEEEDGILTAEEVASLRLTGVEWAVLSACDTGLGEIKAGEGVIGLRRAFQVAGARTVIMSLWSVEDRAARQWMRALYRERLEEHLDTAEAARAASLSVLRDRRAARASTHPFFWAAFVAAGDWR